MHICSLSLTHFHLKSFTTLLLTRALPYPKISHLEHVSAIRKMHRGARRGDGNRHIAACTLHYICNWQFWMCYILRRMAW